MGYQGEWVRNLFLDAQMGSNFMFVSGNHLQIFSQLFFLLKLYLKEVGKRSEKIR